jgi:hypothetical protein
MLNLKQTDCRFGGVAFAAGEDLSLKTGHLARLNAGGDLVLPQGAGEITPYVLVQGADQGYLCGAVPLTSAGNCRVKLAGMCEAGDLLVAKGDGRVETGVIGGEALPVGMAEEKGVDGQHVLLRPLAVGTKGADGADGAPGAAGAQGPAGADGAAGAPGTEFLLDPASLINAQPNQVGALIGLEGGMWNGSVPGMGATLSALVTGTRTVGGSTLLVCVLLWDVGAGTVMFCQLPVSMIGTPVDPLAVGGYVCGVDDGSLTGCVVRTTGYDVSIFNYNMLRCVAVADGIATFRSHYNP